MRLPHLYDGKLFAHAQRIMVTAGPLAADYEALGTVGVVQRTFPQANPGQVNDALRSEALLRLGHDVGAVINVAYTINPKNVVNATGLAGT